MMQIREVRVVGPGKAAASVAFRGGPNVVSGPSDTGKSYIVRCVDYLFGAKTFGQSINEAAGYETVFVELENDRGDFLTIGRSLRGGDIVVHRSPINAMQGEGQVVQWSRKGASAAPDISSVLFEFSGIPEVSLRANSRGKKQRLTLRTLLPTFLVREGTVIAERSPLYGEGGFSTTAHQRMLSFVLTGADDSSVITEDDPSVRQAIARAKLTVIDELLQRLSSRSAASTGERNPVDQIKKLDAEIQELTSGLEHSRREQIQLQRQRVGYVTELQRAEAQLQGIDELLSRYELLDQRYHSDLQRLDFLSEGVHYLDQLQVARCPVCGHIFTADHDHTSEADLSASSIYEAAKAEAAKILAHRSDLRGATESLRRKRGEREDERTSAEALLTIIDAELGRQSTPRPDDLKTRLDELLKKRIELENRRADTEQIDSLRAQRAYFESDIAAARSSKRKKWNDVDQLSLHHLCQEISGLLKEWNWKGDAHVVFDTKSFDIVVDGRHRQSHGKGVRAILHTALVIGLMKYCIANKKPHAGFLVVDSPLTTFKEKRGDIPKASDRWDPSIESAFWTSLSKLPNHLQIIIVDNKEPPPHLQKQLRAHFFVGEGAKPNERGGFFPS
jgi:hypothetical protein